MRIESGQPLLDLAVTQRGITAHVHKKPVEIHIPLVEWLDEDETLKRYEIDALWKPSAKHINLNPSAQPPDLLTQYGSPYEAIIATTNSLAAQFAEACGSISTRSNSPEFKRHVPSEIRKRDFEPRSNDQAVTHVNQEILRQEMSGVLGEFLIAWQWFECRVRILNMLTRKEEGPLRDSYLPSREGVTRRVKKVINKSDGNLYTRIMNIIKMRNNIIHGLVSFEKGPADNRMRSIIGHHDLWASALVNLAETGSKHGEIMFPANSGSYTAPQIIKLIVEVNKVSSKLAHIGRTLAAKRKTGG